MRHPAGDDKNAETNKHPVEGQIAAFLDEKEERNRNDEISGGDQKIRDQMQTHQSRIPQVTMAVRHEAVLAKESRKEIHTTQIHNAGNALTRRVQWSRDQWHRRHYVATLFLATTQAEVEKATEPD